MNTKKTIESESKTSVTAPTRRVSRSSCASRLIGCRSFLPEQLPWIALEVADQLAQVTVDIVARQQRACSAFAGAQVGDHAVDVVDEAAGFTRGGRCFVGRTDRFVDAFFGDDLGDTSRVIHERQRRRRQ